MMYIVTSLPDFDKQNIVQCGNAERVVGMWCGLWFRKLQWFSVTVLLIQM